MGFFGNLVNTAVGNTTHPWRVFNNAHNQSALLGPKKEFSDKPFLNLLKDYEDQDSAAQQKVFSSYQQGENAALAKNAAAGKSAIASTGQSLIGRGLYNSTQRSVEENKARAGEDAGRLAIAGGRASLLDATRPNPSVYGPLVQDYYTNPKGATPQAKQLIDKMNANDQAATSAATGAYTGSDPYSAASRLKASVADESKSVYGPLGNIGTATAGRLASERGRVGQASIYGASMGTEEAKRPQPGVYGPLIAQLSSTPVQQNPLRQAVGSILPGVGAAAGGVVGGMFGGPVGGMAGSVAGGALGGYAGGQVGGASYGPYAGNGPNYTLQGLNTGVGMAGKFGGMSFGGDGTSAGARPMPGGISSPTSYGDYPNPPRDSNYYNSRTYGGGLFIS